MNEKRKLPLLVDIIVKTDLERVATQTLIEFTEKIYPILNKFGLLDDAHIQKYLSCETTESIYNDALTEQPLLVSSLYKVVLYSKEDVWKDLRAANSPVKSPKEEGFIYADIPAPGGAYQKKVIKAISVKDGRMEINKEVLESESIIRPSERQEELYNLVATFCDALKSINAHKYQKTTLFTNTNDGIKPNIQGILNNFWCVEKKK